MSYIDHAGEPGLGGVFFCPENLRKFHLGQWEKMGMKAYWAYWRWLGICNKLIWIKSLGNIQDTCSYSWQLRKLRVANPSCNCNTLCTHCQVRHLFETLVEKQNAFRFQTFPLAETFDASEHACSPHIVLRRIMLRQILVHLIVLA